MSYVIEIYYQDLGNLSRLVIRSTMLYETDYSLVKNSHFQKINAMKIKINGYANTP